MAVSYKQNLEGVYENRELGKVQPTTEQHYASLDTKLQNENVYQDIQILSEVTSVKIAPQKREKKKATSQKYLWTVALVAMVASILAIIGVIIVAGVYVSALQENTATLTRQIVELENKLNQTHNTAMAQLSSLQSSMNTLTTRVNSPMNLYQNCTEETRSCSLLPTSRSTTNYWRWCDTARLPINRTVSINIVQSFCVANIIL